MSHSFSISVPVGAWHPFLPSCLASLAAQDVCLHVSLLDASGDSRVVDLANKYAALLHYRRHGPDRGQAAAIVEGWANAPGDVLGWLNADDILAPGALAKALAAFEGGSSLDLVCGHSAILDEKARMVGYHWEVEPPGPRILEANIISQPSCFFKRAACDAAGGLDENLHYTMDWDLWIRLHLCGAKAGFIDAPLSMVMWGERTKTISWSAQRRAELRRLIDVYAPAGQRAKIYRAFAIHHLLSRTGTPALARVLDRQGKSVYGIRLDGSVGPGARIFLAHFDDKPREGVTVELASGAGDIDVSVSEPARCDVVGPKNIEITFEIPVGPGREVIVAIDPRRQSRLRFRHARWR